MKKKIGAMLLTIFWILSGHLLAEESPKPGALIVTYQTPKGQRLDRIRFWIKNENHKQWLYPKGNAYVDDPIELTRMVVIENLQPGTYTLEFLIPNTDGMFKEVPNRQIVVMSGDVIKVDQLIKPRNPKRKLVKRKKEQKTEVAVPLSQNDEVDSIFQEEQVIEETIEYKPEPQKLGKLIISYDLKNEPKYSDQIRLKLVDAEGEVTIHPKQESDTIVPLNAGKMVMIQKLPIGDYSLEFFLEGEQGNLELPVYPLHIEENKTKSLHHSFSMKQKVAPEHD